MSAGRLPFEAISGCGFIRPVGALLRGGGPLRTAARSLAFAQHPAAPPWPPCADCTAVPQKNENSGQIGGVEGAISTASPMMLRCNIRLTHVT
jgi:hypothetical protein